MNRHARALLFAAILPMLVGAGVWFYHAESSEACSEVVQSPESQPADDAGRIAEAGTATPAPPPDVEDELNRTRRDLDLALSLLEKSFGTPVKLENVRTTPVTLTAYSSTPDQCDLSPHITASNKPVRHGVIAVSDDIMKELGIGFGQRVLIPGYGVFMVQDRMNRRWHRRVDIWHSDREAARLFGIQKGTMLWISDQDGDKGKRLIAMADARRS